MEQVFGSVLVGHEALAYFEQRVVHQRVQLSERLAVTLLALLYDLPDAPSFHALYFTTILRPPTIYNPGLSPSAESLPLAYSAVPTRWPLRE